MTNVDFKARHNARRVALQALFQWYFSGGDVQQIAQQYFTVSKASIDKEYFEELLFQVTTHHQQLDQQLSNYTEREITDHSPVELALLRIAAYELIHRHDVPSRVILNEAIELAKQYGAQDSYKYINGVLDKLALNLREDINE